MRGSKLFRPDQYSYLLYPNKNLPGFLEKNNIPKEDVLKSKLLTDLLNEDRQLFEDMGHKMKSLAEMSYSWKKISEEYSSLFNN